MARDALELCYAEAKSITSGKPIARRLTPMIENLPVKTLSFKGLTIEGYSRAAVQSYWRIQELKLGFELGGSPWSFTGTPTFFVTHSHLDHLASIPVFVARRRMMKMEPPTIYLPPKSRWKTSTGCSTSGSGSTAAGWPSNWSA